MGFVLILGKSGAAELFNGTALPRCGFVKTEKADRLCAAECAVIVGEQGCLPDIDAALGIIINSDSTDALPELSGGIQVITCGISPKNTVCVASRTSDTISLSLNRGVQTLGGICEPLELPVKVPHSVAAYDCMAAFASAVLLGEIRE